MKRPLKIVFFGNENLATGVSSDAPVLRALMKAGYEMCSIVVHETTSKSRSNKKFAVHELAEKYDIPLLNPHRPLDILPELQHLKPDIGVLVAYGRLVPQVIIDLFPAGIVNIHPSLLPRYRGSTPIEQALLDGLNETGVSLMSLVSEMDAGPIYAQTATPISAQMTKDELAKALSELGARLLVENIEGIVDGSIVPVQQDESKASFTERLNSSFSVLDPQKPAELLERQIRAFAGWPKSRFSLSSIDIIVHRACVTDIVIPPAAVRIENHLLLIGTETTALSLEVIQLPGKQKISAEEFIRGYSRLVE